MKIVGLTGNIGAGKSTISQIFSELGFPIFDSDWVGKKLISEDKNVATEIKKLLGDEVFSQNRPDRAKIASKVFKNQTLLSQLNAIIHPKVQFEFEKWIKIQKSEFVIREAAILIESNKYEDLDALILVICNEEERIKRVMKRDQADRNQVIDRIKRQMSEEEKLKYANFVIDNNTGTMVLPQVITIVNKIKNESA